MRVRNLSGSPISGIVLRRQVDLDVDTGGALGTAGFNNWFGASERDSVTAWNPANQTAQEDHAVMLRHYRRTPGTIPTFAKVTGDILDTSCSPANIAADDPVEGDYGATIQYNIGTIGRGASATVEVQYQRN
jgi:hypothetical protein